MILYKTIAVSISIIAAISIFCGTWLGTLLLVDYITNAIAHAIDIKPIIEVSKAGILSNGAQIKLHELHNDPTDNVKQISTPKHKPSSTLCSPGSKKFNKKGNKK